MLKNIEPTSRTGTGLESHLQDLDFTGQSIIVGHRVAGLFSGVSLEEAVLETVTPC